MNVLELSKSIDVNVPASEAWNVLGDLSKAKDWIPGITKSDIIEGKRYCQLMDGNEIIEEFPLYSAENYEFEYIQVKNPLPVNLSSGRMNIEANGDSSTIFWKSKLEFISEEMKSQLSEMIDKSFDSALMSLKNKIETG